MTRWLCVMVAALVVAVPLRAQPPGTNAAVPTPGAPPAPPATSAEPPPAFEVASVKRNTSNELGTRFNIQPGGRFVVTSAAVATLVTLAYGLQPFQIVGLPDWAMSERYDVNAKAEAGVPVGGPAVPGGPPSGLMLMVRSLLAERFAFAAHSEQREQAISRLVLARSDGRLGPKLTPSAVDCEALIRERGRGDAPPPPPTPPAPGEVPKCGMMMMPNRVAAGGQPLGQLARIMSGRLRRIVVDGTGLAGTYDFVLEFAPDQAVLQAPAGADPIGPAPAASDAPSLLTALQEQLGLKLENARGPVETLVVDRVERPTPD